MSRSIGIDLGTTNCCVYAADGDHAALVPSREGRATTPSVVAFTGDGVLVGDPAQRQAVTNPTRTIFGIKRLMGRKRDAPDIVAVRDRSPFAIVAAANGDAWIRVDDRDVSPQEVSALLLEHLKHTAEDYLGEPVAEAVITVPAFFDEVQRKATRDAARLAGYERFRLLNEPTAAALAYGLDRGGSQRIAVFDLGGGTFDISILQVHEGAFDVLAIAGDNLLGGDDFDRRLIAMLLDDFKTQHGIDLLGDPTAMQRLYEGARNAKHELSQVQKVSIELPFIAVRGAQPIHLSYPELAREELEYLVQEEIESLVAPCQMALEDAGVGTDDLDQVLLVGGMTRMPAVQNAVETLFRRRPRRDLSPDEIVAKGAALHAAMLAGQLDQVVLFDVTPHSLGIRVRGDRFSPVIRRNSRVPCRADKPFKPSREEQRFVVLEVYQGESEVVDDNTHLGRFTLSDLPPKTHVLVSFGLDADGILTVSATEPISGRAASIEIQAASGLGEKQIARLLAERRARPERGARAPGSDRRASARPRASSDRYPAPASAAVDRRGGTASSPVARSDRPPRDETPSQVRTTAIHELPTAPSPAQAALAEPPLAPRPPADANGPDGAPPSGKTGHATLRSAGSDSAPDDDPLVGTCLDGRYRIERVLGEGGMGRVYLARHDVLARPFAIKVLHADLALSRQNAERFVLEARAAASIASEHVVAISDFGRTPDESAYFVMEYLEGQTLRQLLLEHGALSIEMVVTIARQLCAALTAAHAAGVVHRDLKPENVTLVERGSHPCFCKILDFGIAKILCREGGERRAGRLTLAGTVVGTPQYMSPEQIEGREVDPRCDVYSLGVVLYEMVTGELPFQADSLVGLLTLHKHAPPVPVRKHAAGMHCPEALEALVLRCLAKMPEDRFQTAVAVGAALDAAARSLPPTS